MNIFVGNLSKDVTDQDLQNLFSQHGAVREVKVIKDMFSGESKGFAFIEMPGLKEAQTAIKELNTVDLKGKKLVVNEARPKGSGNDSRSRGNNFRSGGGSGGGRSRY
ncbi:MAG: RNA-binding protein [Bacteroidota bacterium]|nr:RNA-binding protein [Bacteroidota bacterium]